MVKIIVLIAFFVGQPFCFGADAGTIRTSTDLRVFLVTDKAEETTTLGMPKGRLVKDIIFKYVLKEDAKNFTSWAFEVTEMDEKLVYRTGAEGKLPPLLHWDGFFNPDAPLKPNRKYFIRLLLIYKDGSAAASPWSFFSTKVMALVGGPKVKGNVLDLYVLPSGSFHALFTQTKTAKTVSFPCLQVDVRLIWNEVNTFGVRIESTSNLIMGYSVHAAGLFYSDISLYYRYRLLGSPVRAPVLPVFPPYADTTLKKLDYKIEKFSKPHNLEVGIRSFNTLLRGYEGAPIDPELARFVQGLSFVTVFEQALGVFRGHLTGEAGYTLFKGRCLFASGELGITYQGLTTVAPGLFFRYQVLSGKPAPDQFNADTDITNKMVFGGIAIHMKL
ncbi:MAG: hypothetical protein HY537_04635 [Deltaproteobacteria bacterium]|nr:hypothetical protein [Deltaproteobacteria bacterium]